MKLRYFIELAFFAIAVFFFQVYITSFNTDLHKISIDFTHLSILGVLSISPEGLIVIPSQEE